MELTAELAGMTETKIYLDYSGGSLSFDINRLFHYGQWALTDFWKYTPYVRPDDTQKKSI